jgi:hypothetical protein
MKKEATQTCKVPRKRPLMKKEATPNTQGAKKKDLWWKKRQPQTRKGLRKKPSDEKIGNSKHARG